jgi:hypothetical protein
MLSVSSNLAAAPAAADWKLRVMLPERHSPCSRCHVAAGASSSLRSHSPQSPRTAVSLAFPFFLRSSKPAEDGCSASPVAPDDDAVAPVAPACEPHVSRRIQL